MKYPIDSEVIYRKTGKTARIHDYSHRYKDYTLTAGGRTYYNVKEDDIRASVEPKGITSCKTVDYS